MHFSQQIIGGNCVQYIAYPQHLTALAGGAERIERPPAKIATKAKTKIAILNLLNAIIAIITSLSDYGSPGLQFRNNFIFALLFESSRPGIQHLSLG